MCDVYRGFETSTQSSSGSAEQLRRLLADEVSFYREQTCWINTTADVEWMSSLLAGSVSAAAVRHTPRRSVILRLSLYIYVSFTDCNNFSAFFLRCRFFSFQLCFVNSCQVLFVQMKETVSQSATESACHTTVPVLAAEYVSASFARNNQKRSEIAYLRREQCCYLANRTDLIQSALFYGHTRTAYLYRCVWSGIGLTGR